MDLQTNIYVDLNLSEAPTFDDILKVLEIVRSSSYEELPEVLLLSKLKTEFSSSSLSIALYLEQIKFRGNNYPYFLEVLEKSLQSNNLCIVFLDYHFEKKIIDEPERSRPFEVEVYFHEQPVEIRKIGDAFQSSFGEEGYELEENEIEVLEKTKAFIKIGSTNISELSFIRSDLAKKLTKELGATFYIGWG